jgi:hypothetical protein
MVPRCSRSRHSGRLPLDAARRSVSRDQLRAGAVGISCPQTCRIGIRRDALSWIDWGGRTAPCRCRGMAVGGRRAHTSREAGRATPHPCRICWQPTVDMWGERRAYAQRVGRSRRRCDHAGALPRPGDRAKLGASRDPDTCSCRRSVAPAHPVNLGPRDACNLRCPRDPIIGREPNLVDHRDAHVRQFRLRGLNRFRTECHERCYDWTRIGTWLQADQHACRHISMLPRADVAMQESTTE